MNLYLLTDSFPYTIGMEDTFLLPELHSLEELFDSITLIPMRKGGLKLEIDSAKISCDESLADFLQKQNSVQKFLSGFFSPIFWQELSQCPDFIRHKSGLFRTLRHASLTEFCCRWMKNHLPLSSSEQNTVIYTYWCIYTTHAAVMMKRHHPEIKVISRAHGYDVYRSLYQPACIPGQKTIIDGLDRLYLISEAGRKHLLEAFPAARDTLKVFRLGISNPGFNTCASPSGFIRLVSCSNLIPVKRVDRMAAGILEYANTHPQTKVEWVHFGDGTDKAIIQSLLEKSPENLSCRWMGQQPNSVVFQFYHEQSVDIFLNTSQSEGISVAMMEAASCGIPILATAVGGTPEIVSEQNGYLLSTDPTAAEISAGIELLTQDTSAHALKQKQCKIIWQQKFNAEKNFPAFAEDIKGLFS